MGAVKKPIKKVKTAVNKQVKKATKFVDKKVVEPLERPVKKVIKAVDKAVTEPIEKVIKKVGTEVKDTVAGTDKTDRNPPSTSQTASARTAKERQLSEEPEATVETTQTKMRTRRKGKKALVVAGGGATNVGGGGATGLNIPKG